MLDPRLGSRQALEQIDRLPSRERWGGLFVCYLHASPARRPRLKTCIMFIQFHSQCGRRIFQIHPQCGRRAFQIGDVERPARRDERVYAGETPLPGLLLIAPAVIRPSYAVAVEHFASGRHGRDPRVGIDS